MGKLVCDSFGIMCRVIISLLTPAETKLTDGWLMEVPIIAKEILSTVLCYAITNKIPELKRLRNLWILWKVKSAENNIGY